MTKSRKIYTNKNYDISIIELNITDLFNEEDMLCLDTNIYDKDDLVKYYNIIKKGRFILCIIKMELKLDIHQI